MGTTASAGELGGSGMREEKVPFRYDATLANEIEARWQDYWAERGTFHSPNPAGPLADGFSRLADRRKFYVLDFFPYPSGAGLHVGHLLGYIGTDVFARYLRMTGRNVLHPFGYDAFGLPAEQYAIDTGKHPEETARKNIDTYRRQLGRLGLGHDVRREVVTTDPSYYRWTQWIFLRIFASWYDADTDRARPIGELVADFECGRRPVPDGRVWSELPDRERRDLIDAHRLAYLSTEMVNWCPGLGTVLANEEVTADGRSGVGNYPVYRRPLRQWMLRITAYAERLLSDLDVLDWPEPVKQMQRNWIGASDGASIDFAVAGAPDKHLTVFTTRPDTLPGATYIVVAPEHPLAAPLSACRWPDNTPPEWTFPQGRTGQTRWRPDDAVRAYQAMAARRSERQRAAGGRARTGVFTGSHAVNPATGEQIPVFVADYVLMAYGTGAIMAVPAHDQRDLEFAAAFGLGVRAVLRPPPDWLAARGVTSADPADQWPEAFTGDGQYVSDFGMGLAGRTSGAGIETALGWLEVRGAGHPARCYRLRDWLFSRQRYWGEPFPVVYDQAGDPHALPDHMLPVTLPEMTDFRPEPQPDDAEDPVPPLARATDWANVELDLGDGPRRYRRELNTMPQWAGSCWYYLRYLDPGNDEVLVNPEVERYWMGPPGDGGVDLYVGGAEHAVLHLLYARFWHKVLYDLGYVSTREPFRRLFNQGDILADAFTDARGMYVPAAEVTEGPDGTLAYRGEPVRRRAGRMGKSRKNGVSPDDICAAYGADTLRLYEMGMGPLDSGRPWHPDDIVGSYRFLQRLWRAIVDEASGEIRVSDAELDEETTRRLHRTIRTVRADFAELRFNTAIARLIELTAHAGRVGAGGTAGSRARPTTEPRAPLATAVPVALPRKLAEPLVLMVAPLAPHIAEELWRRLGHEQSLAFEPFPAADSVLAAEPSVTLPVQVNGKTRFTIEVPAGASEEQVRQVLQANANFERYTSGTTVERLIIVPDRIVNILVQ